MPSTLLRMILQSVRDGVLVVHSLGEIVQHNARFREMWQIPPSMVLTEFADEDAVRFVLGQLEHPQAFLKKIEELSQDPDAESFDVLTFRDGRVFERVSKPYLVDGKPGGRIWLFHDVTSSKRLQVEEALRIGIAEELHSAYQFVNAIVENIPDMLFVKDAKDLKFVRFNRAGEELIGYSRDEMLGKSDYDFFTKSQADFFTFNDRAVLECGQMIDVEETIRTRYKGERLLRTKKIPICDEHGKPAYLLGIAEDITDWKAAETLGERLFQEQVSRREVEKAVQLRDEFFAIATHELRAPLTTLRMRLQLLEKAVVAQPENGSQAKELLYKLKKQVDRLSKRITLLFDVSRIRADRLDLNTARCDLAILVQQVVERLEPYAQSSQSEIKLELGPDLQGNWDQDRIEQVIENLLCNAIKFGAGAPIRIEARVQGDWVTVRVQDWGVGISAEDQERVFARFERATTNRKQAGMGLGLWISKHIVIAHGGKLRLQSELGKGATFIVELPCNP